MNSDDRLDAVEIKLAHLERALQEISDVVARQQQQLEITLAGAQRLYQRLAELEGGGASATAEETPPHY